MRESDPVKMLLIFAAASLPATVGSATNAQTYVAPFDGSYVVQSPPAPHSGDFNIGIGDGGYRYSVADQPSDATGGYLAHDTMVRSFLFSEVNVNSSAFGMTAREALSIPLNVPSAGRYIVIVHGTYLQRFPLPNALDLAGVRSFGGNIVLSLDEASATSQVFAEFPGLGGKAVEGPPCLHLDDSAVDILQDSLLDIFLQVPDTGPLGTLLGSALAIADLILPTKTCYDETFTLRFNADLPSGPTPLHVGFITNLTSRSVNPLLVGLGGHATEVTAFLRVDSVELLPGSGAENQPPELSEQAVTPSVGTNKTHFQYRVHYYDPDGDDPIHAQVHIAGADQEVRDMQLKPGSGSSANGTYVSDPLALSVGSHTFYFVFADAGGGSAVTPVTSGPTVASAQGATIIQFWFGGGGGVPVTDDFEIRYSVKNDCDDCLAGPFEVIPGSQLPYPGVLEVIDTPTKLCLQALTLSDNHEFREWEIRCDAALVSESTASIICVSVDSCGELSVASYWRYTPGYYTLSGNVSASAGPLAGATITLSGRGQASTMTDSDGDYAFSSVPGGVSYIISAAHSQYTCIPLSHNIANLIESGTYDFVCTSSDGFSPESVVTGAPPAYVNDTSSVTFQWTGIDNVTPSDLLEFQYRLLGSANEAWSPWSMSTNRTYDLANGVYTFELKARDEAGNVSLSPARHTFAVASAPQVASAGSLDEGIWFGTLEVLCPSDAATTCDDLVILPEQFGLSGDDFAPVRLFSSVGEGAIGTIDYAVEGLELPAVFADAQIGFNLTVPVPLAPGESAGYTIQWGKLVHMGWEEEAAISPFNNLSCAGDDSPVAQFAHSAYLDTTERYSRLESKEIYRIHPGCFSTTRDGYLFQRSFAPGQPETVRELAYHPADFHPYPPGDPTPSYYGTSRTFLYLHPGFVATPFELWVFWQPYEYTYNPLDAPPLYGRQRRAFSFQRFNKTTLNPIGDAFVSELVERDFWCQVARAGDGTTWLLARTGDEQVVYSKLDPAGELAAHRLPVAPSPTDLTNQFVTDCNLVGGRNGRAWFFYSREWEASPTNSQQRGGAYLTILNQDGSVFMPETQISPPLAGPSEEVYDVASTESGPVLGVDGRVWISFHRATAGEVTYSYSVFNPDGTFFRELMPLGGSNRRFRFADSDGYIWTTGPDGLVIRTPDDTPAHAPWPGDTVIPNQPLGVRAAQVELGGYRIFDRWSARPIDVYVESGQRPNILEIIDCDKFGQEVHVEELSMMAQASPCVEIPGELPQVLTIPICGCLDHGVNGMSFSQEGLLGGELLIAFPLLTADADADGDGDVGLSDYRQFEECLGGPDTCLTDGCKQLGLDWDGDSDLADLAVFYSEFTGDQ